MKTGIEIIANERLRQIEQEGYSIEDDKKHNSDGQLAKAACAYLYAPFLKNTYRFGHQVPIGFWPEYWKASAWKPTPNDRIKELAKAGALIAAEIDRLNNQTTT
jgi:hypothetical protein